MIQASEDCLAEEEEICRKGPGGKMSRSHPCEQATKAANSMLGQEHRLRETITPFTWHSVDFTYDRVQLRVPNTRQSSTSWSEFNKGPPSLCWEAVSTFRMKELGLCSLEKRIF